MPTDKQTIAWYNENAEEYTAHVRNPEDSVYHSYYEKPAMYALLPDLKDKKVISLGCGSGEDSNYLKKLGSRESIGIDISSELIKIAEKQYRECEFKIMDMEHLEFPDESFYFAYSSLAIHYLEDWSPVFKEVYRILKPGSFFLFSCGSPVRYSMEGADTEKDWVSKLEIVKNKITKEVTITGSYLDRKKITSGLGKQNITVITWKKSYGEISSEILSSGFLIEQIVEPKPLESLKTIYPEKYKKLSKIPEFAIFRLKKI